MSCLAGWLLRAITCPAAASLRFSPLFGIERYDDSRSASLVVERRCVSDVDIVTTCVPSILIAEMMEEAAGSHDCLQALSMASFLEYCDGLPRGFDEKSFG